jgi:hypothetical protein
MAVDPRKRQQQLAKKAAKRKIVQAAKRDSHGGGNAESAAKRLGIMEAFPVYECLVPDGIFEVGIGNVCLTRKLPNGDLAVALFLVDAFCLGVKNALFKIMSQSQYAQALDHLSENESFAPSSPECARKLVESAEAYAADIGFAPHPDYRWARKIFGDIDAGACTKEFTFGKDGKPFFMSGPNDTPAKCKQIMNTLAKRFGPSGFHFTTEVAKEDFMMLASGEEKAKFFPSLEVRDEKEQYYREEED